MLYDFYEEGVHALRPLPLCINLPEDEFVKFIPSAAPPTSTHHLSSPHEFATKVGTVPSAATAEKSSGICSSCHPKLEVYCETHKARHSLGDVDDLFSAVDKEVRSTTVHDKATETEAARKVGHPPVTAAEDDAELEKAESLKKIADQLYHAVVRLVVDERVRQRSVKTAAPSEGDAGVMTTRATKWDSVRKVSPRRGLLQPEPLYIDIPATQDARDRSFRSSVKTLKKQIRKSDDSAERRTPIVFSSKKNGYSPKSKGISFRGSPRIPKVSKKPTPGVDDPAAMYRRRLGEPNQPQFNEQVLERVKWLRDSAEQRRLALELRASLTRATASELAQTDAIAAIRHEQATPPSLSAQQLQKNQVQPPEQKRTIEDAKVAKLVETVDLILANVEQTTKTEQAGIGNEARHSGAVSQQAGQRSTDSKIYYQQQPKSFFGVQRVTPPQIERQTAGPGPLVPLSLPPQSSQRDRNYSKLYESADKAIAEHEERLAELANTRRADQERHEVELLEREHPRQEAAITDSPVIERSSSIADQQSPPVQDPNMKQQFSHEDQPNPSAAPSQPAYSDVLQHLNSELKQIQQMGSSMEKSFAAMRKLARYASILSGLEADGVTVSEMGTIKFDSDDVLMLNRSTPLRSQPAAAFSENHIPGENISPSSDQRYQRSFQSTRNIQQPRINAASLASRSKGEVVMYSASTISEGQILHNRAPLSRLATRTDTDNFASAESAESEDISSVTSNTERLLAQCLDGADAVSDDDTLIDEEGSVALPLDSLLPPRHHSPMHRPQMLPSGSVEHPPSHPPQDVPATIHRYERTLMSSRPLRSRSHSNERTSSALPPPPQMRPSDGRGSHAGAIRGVQQQIRDSHPTSASASPPQRRNRLGRLNEQPVRGGSGPANRTRLVRDAEGRLTVVARPRQARPHHVQQESFESIPASAGELEKLRSRLANAQLSATGYSHHARSLDGSAASGDTSLIDWDEVDKLAETVSVHGPEG